MQGVFLLYTIIPGIYLVYTRCISGIYHRPGTKFGIYKIYHCQSAISEELGYSIECNIELLALSKAIFPLRPEYLLQGTVFKDSDRGESFCFDRPYGGTFLTWTARNHLAEVLLL
jgi:hypothetical protein